MAVGDFGVVEVERVDLAGQVEGKVDEDVGYLHPALHTPRVGQPGLQPGRTHKNTHTNTLLWLKYPTTNTQLSSYIEDCMHRVV